VSLPNHRKGLGGGASGLLTMMTVKKRCADFRSKLARWGVVYLG